jgi:hypothetical protein
MGDPGYRDALCEVIAYAVTSTAVSGEVGLVVDFDLGSVVIKPGPGRVAGPEIAMLRGFTDRPDWIVWRPDEAPFGDFGWS